MTTASPNSSSDGARWMAALLISIGINGLAFLIFATVMGREWIKQAQNKEAVPLEPANQVVAVIRPEMIRPQIVNQAAATQPSSPPPAVQQPPPSQGYLRTSPAQESDVPTQAKFIGERNTRATSDTAPVEGAPMIPSQEGREPRHPLEIETTESRYQDGNLAEIPTPPSQSFPQNAANSTPIAQQDSSELPDPALADQVTKTIPLQPPPQPPAPLSPNENLKGAEIPRITENKRIREAPEMQTADLAKKEPEPVESNPIRQEELPKQSTSKSTEIKQPLPDSSLAQNKEATNLPKPKSSKPIPIRDPAFRGYQQKTKLRGSIARRGTSAMDVVDSPLGRYHAQLSRAIEKEWQLNCKRYRDNIVPGSLTLSFLIDPTKGTVKSITFLDVFKGSEIQKGFTIKSIRDAELPALPKAVSEELDGEPLEVTYSFHF